MTRDNHSAAAAQAHQIIPAPHDVEWLAEPPLAVEDLCAIDGRSEETAPVAQILEEMLEGLAGARIPANGSISASRPFVRLELAPAEVGSAPFRTAGVSPSGGDPENERYTLVVRSSGVVITAQSVEGLMRGSASFVQLVSGAQEVDGQRHLAAVAIADGPRFAWRGLSLDVARHFFSVEQVCEVIDLIALYKLNVLHLHLTDDEGWRIEIVAREALTRDRAGEAVDFYTQEQFATIVAYAQSRFVTVVPEIDMPGHAAAVAHGYPSLTRAYADNSLGDVLAHARSLDVSNEETYRFVEDVVKEVAGLIPTPYVHIGGDEAFGMPHDDYVGFVERARSIVSSVGKRTIGWQEVLRSGLAQDEVAQYWFDRPVSDVFSPDSLSFTLRTPEQRTALMAAFADMHTHPGLAREQGASVLLSPTSYCYLDRPHAEPSIDAAQEDMRARLGMPVYQPKTVEQLAHWDPASVVDAGDETPDIAGVEAVVWCETVTDMSDLQFLLLPRLPSIAEKSWAARAPQQGSWDEYASRLAAHAPMWTRAGWTYFASSTVPWREGDRPIGL